MRQVAFVMVLVLALLGVALAGCPTVVPCPLHDNVPGVFTGAIEWHRGRMWGIFKCPQEHTFMVLCN